LCKTSKVLIKTQKVMFKTSEVLFKTQKAMFKTSEVLIKTQKAMFKTSKVLFKTQKVMCETSEVLFKTQKVMCETSEVLFKTQKVMCETSEVLCETHGRQPWAPAPFPDQPECHRDQAIASATAAGFPSPATLSSASNEERAGSRRWIRGRIRARGLGRLVVPGPGGGC
jgi:hypothetical protein